MLFTDVCRIDLQGTRAASLTRSSKTNLQPDTQARFTSKTTQTPSIILIRDLLRENGLKFTLHFSIHFIKLIQLYLHDESDKFTSTITPPA